MGAKKCTGPPSHGSFGSLESRNKQHGSPLVRVQAGARSLPAGAGALRSGSAVLPSRWPGAWHWKLDGPSSPTRAFTGSSMPRSARPRTIAGAIFSHGPSPNGAGGDAKGAVLPPSSSSGVPCFRPLGGRSDAVDRLSSCTSATPACIALRQNGNIASAMTQVLGAFPPQWRRSVAFDNGNSRHHRLHALDIETFFCDTHGRRDGNDRPHGGCCPAMDLAELTDDAFDRLLANHNNTPRKCLGYYTPAEIFVKIFLSRCCT